MRLWQDGKGFVGEAEGLTRWPVCLLDYVEPGWHSGCIWKKIKLHRLLPGH